MPASSISPMSASGDRPVTPLLTVQTHGSRPVTPGSSRPATPVVISPGLRDAVDKWDFAFRDAVQCEEWGQIDDAKDRYLAIRRDIVATVSAEYQTLTQPQRLSIVRLGQLVLKRSRDIDLVLDGKHMDGDMDGILATIKMVASHNKVGPIAHRGEGLPAPPFDGRDLGEAAALHEISREVLRTQPRANTPPPLVGVEARPSGVAATASKLTYHIPVLLPPPGLSAGSTAIVLNISHVHLKEDPMPWLEPVVKVGARNSPGCLLEPEQITTPPQRIGDGQNDPFGLVFDCAVYLQTPLEVYPPNTNIYFEVVHYKLEKRRSSTRCWAMLSIEGEVTPAARQFSRGDSPVPLVLELYEKPCDFKATHFKAYSSRKLYMHVSLGFVRK